MQSRPANDQGPFVYVRARYKRLLHVSNNLVWSKTERGVLKNLDSADDSSATGGQAQRDETVVYNRII